ncbi:hypothetical protein [Changchengzhania lutea]|uniref:hypothetical protein n=1 Tax=Changchengzhania lutea TaxID=2049305 RepID=UPI00115D023B|nr:hypothetical protein [Changchengzhania lutea]
MINGKPYSDYGFIPINFYGFLDMPSRLGETFYDWGEYIEPLVHEDDLFWKSREFKIDVFFDNRLTLKTFNQSVNELSSIVGFFPITNEFGTFNVKLKEVNKLKHFNDLNVVYRLVFVEEEPMFIGAIPAAVGGLYLTIDGYSLFSDFKVLTEIVKLNDNIATLKQSRITTSTPQKQLTDFRTFKNIEIKCHMLKSDDYINNINRLKKLLSQSDFRQVVYKSVDYKCFITDGFSVKIEKEKIQFTIYLNIFSQVGLFTDSLFGSTLFFNGNQKKIKESLFEYNLFKTGIFQR